MPEPEADARPIERLGWRVASIGLGTGSLPATNEPAVIRQQAAVIRAAVCGGIDLIDCASNYARGAAEATLGCVLADLLAQGEVRRERLVVCTKGGYFGDGEAHSLDPDFIEEALDASLGRLQLDQVDLYFLHNPEEQLLRQGPVAFAQAMPRAFERLETLVARGRIRAYGVASAEGLRVTGPGFHAIEDLVDWAGQAGGAGHHFAAVQLPFSLAQPEAWWARHHRLHGEPASALEAARGHGLAVIASAALNRLRLPLGALRQLALLCPTLTRPAQMALQFARSAPGVCCALVGTSDPAHLAQALEVLATPPLDLAAWDTP